MTMVEKKIENKIEANDRQVDQVLNGKKYAVDYFQREYNWEEKHIEQLVTDLTGAFLNEYFEGHSRTEDAPNYNSYFLGPFVVSDRGGERSIIDGQQRLTSITLLLIYLNNLQKDLGLQENLEPLIFSEYRGSKSFNVQVEERTECLRSLFETGEYTVKDDDDESTRNMAARYLDISHAFPDEIKNGALPFFIDWLKYNVILVEIVAFSDENAYTIFETMNDRGLNLTPTEMLKGFLLSKYREPSKRKAANTLWKESIQRLHDANDAKEEDQKFIQAWLRSQYAETIRPGKAGSKNEDFEKIGTRFHSWVRDNLERLGLDPYRAETFEAFVGINFSFYLKMYLKILEAEKRLLPGLEHVYYIARWGIANSLAYPLLLAPLRPEDGEAVVTEKLDIVARYIETFTVRRGVNFRRFAASSIRYTMYSLVKEIRNKDVEELRTILSVKLAEHDTSFDDMGMFYLHGQNRNFVKYLLCRITAFIDKEVGIPTTFETYYHSPSGKPFEIEHIWGDKFDEHRDEFEQENEFDLWRNRIGGLILLPQGTNQSFGAKPYEEKLAHYIKENILAKSLCQATYQNNPNFLNMVNRLDLPFTPHAHFRKSDMEQRHALVQTICTTIWNEDLK